MSFDTQEQVASEPAKKAPHPLEVAGQLMVEFGNGEARVDFRHDTIDVELPDLRAGFSLLRQNSASSRRERLAKLQDVLLDAGLTVKIWVKNDPIGQLGGDAKAGLLSRLLRIDPVEIKVSNVLRHLILPKGQSPTST